MRRAAWAALAAVAFTAGCRNEPRASETVLQAVRAGVVQEVRPEAPERYTATIVPFSQVDLAFKSPGPIESILQVRGADGRMRDVQAGDKVAKGAELAVVRQVDYVQRVEQTQEQLRQAQAQQAAAEAAFRDAKLDFTRAENLYKTASLIKPDYDQARARYESTEAQTEAAKAAVAAAATAVSQAQLALSDTTMRAPSDGWIVARNVDTGSLVSGATVGFSMMSTTAVKAVFAVPDTSLRSVRIGQRQVVALEALGRPVSGTVTAISPQADPKSRVFSVEVSLDNPRDEIRPGMIGSLALGARAEPSRRLAIPFSAVVRAPNNSQAFAVYRIEERSGGTFAVAREIAVGDTYGNSIEVVSGLDAGERIIVLGGELVHDGQQVRVLL
jgi:multidrug efflux system membrane fusion protein